MKQCKSASPSDFGRLRKRTIAYCLTWLSRRNKPLEYQTERSQCWCMAQPSLSQGSPLVLPSYSLVLLTLCRNHKRAVRCHQTRWPLTQTFSNTDAKRPNHHFYIINYRFLLHIIWHLFLNGRWGGTTHNIVGVIYCHLKVPHLQIEDCLGLCPQKTWFCKV